MVVVKNIVVMYHFSLLSSNFNVTINRMIGAPRHGKFIVDKINTCDKRYIRAYIYMVKIQQVDDSTKRI